jgi:hypothetical protein
MENSASLSLLPLTVLILAHQDNLLLQLSVESVKWAMEIIVVWTAEGVPPKFPKHSQVKVIRPETQTGKVTDFSQIRNWSIQQAKQDWIFFLDSDEQAEIQTRQLLAKFFATQKQQEGGVKVRRKDIFLGKEMKWGEVGRVYLPRIFKKNEVKYSRAVHEVPQVEGEVAHSEITLFHYAHDSIQDFLATIIYYAQLEVTLRQKEQQRISWWQVLVWPIGKFWWNYLVKLGFLDGWRGLIYATMMSFHSLTLRAVLYEKNR